METDAKEKSERVQSVNSCYAVSGTVRLPGVWTAFHRRVSCKHRKGNFYKKEHMIFRICKDYRRYHEVLSDLVHALKEELQNMYCT